MDQQISKFDKFYIDIRNIGDAFLLVWKLPEQAIDSDGVKNARVLSCFGELALLSFVKIVISL